MAGVIISLSVILSVVLFGSLVPQGLPAEVYLERYGETMGRLFLTLGLDDIFRTRGFILVGVILFLQLTVCTWHRLRLLRGGIRRWVAGSVLLQVLRLQSYPDQTLPPLAAVRRWKRSRAPIPRFVQKKRSGVPAGNRRTVPSTSQP